MREARHKPPEKGQNINRQTLRKGEGRKTTVLARIWAFLLGMLGIKLEVHGEDPEEEAKEIEKGGAPRGWVFTLWSIEDKANPVVVSRVLVPFASGRDAAVEYVALTAEKLQGRWHELVFIQEDAQGPRVLNRRDRRAAMAILRRRLNRDLGTGRKPQVERTPDVTAHYGKDNGVREPGWVTA